MVARLFIALLQLIMSKVGSSSSCSSLSKSKSLIQVHLTFLPTTRQIFYKKIFTQPAKSFVANLGNNKKEQVFIFTTDKKT